MTKPGISVVIPTHNRAGECLVAIDSALKQTLAPLEVIVVDDHSTQEQRSVLEAGCADDSRVTLVQRSAGSRGPGAARNVGIAAAQGDYIAFLDDDDTWLPEKLEIQAPWLESGFGLVCANAIRSSGNTYFPSDADHEIKRAEILVHNPVIFSTVLVLRALLQEAGPLRDDPWLIGIEDYELLLRLSDRGVRMIRLGAPLARYCDEGTERLSSKEAELSRGLARMAIGRSLRRPADAHQHRATARHTSVAVMRNR